MLSSERQKSKHFTSSFARLRQTLHQKACRMAARLFFLGQSSISLIYGVNIVSDSSKMKDWKEASTLTVLTWLWTTDIAWKLTQKNLSGETNLTKNKRGKRVEFDCLDRAVNGHPTHRCNPTTVWRGSFCLLCFHPGPVRPSLTNLGSLDSSLLPILTPNLARTSDLHRRTAPRSPDLKPSKHPSLQVARLQACATTPGWQITWTI